MAILVFEHSDIGTTGRLGVTLRDHGFTLDIRRPDLHGVGPGGVPGDLDNVHGVVVMGGNQNVTDVGRHPWMQAEAEVIRAAHARQLPVIGICLGAQLIAHALGGEVGPRDRCAVGFYPMRIEVPGQTEPLLAGMAWESPQLFSCGQEVKKLPTGATPLAGARGMNVAMFKAGVRTFGSLAHFECDRAMADALMGASRGQMPGAGITAGEVTAQADQQYAGYARISDRLCVNLATLMFPVARRLSA